jgi:diaminobutyrate-2-oxoglutarate transaminase
MEFGSMQKGGQFMINEVEVFDSVAALDQMDQWESSARTYARRFRAVFTKGEGMILTTSDGRQFIDCLCGAGTLLLGHNHPVVIEAIKGVIERKSPLLMLDMRTIEKYEFMQMVMSVLPPGFASHAKIQFCGPAGTDCVEAAIKLCKTATQRGTMIAFQGGFHGHSQGSLALMGSVGPKVPSLAADCHFFPYPCEYRSVIEIGGEAGALILAKEFCNSLRDPKCGFSKPAGVIIEAIQGEGGVNPAHPEFLRQVRNVTKELGIPLILDEIQAGMGRSGRFWAFEESGITPDVITISKGVGGGLPLAIMVYHQDLDKWGPGAHTGTFRGNTMAFAAGAATIQFILGHDLVANAAAMGDRFKHHLRQLQARWPQIGDIRGRGLMLGLEIVNPDGRPDCGVPPPDEALAIKVRAQCFQRGLLIELGGRGSDVVRFLPPLNITPEMVDRVCEIFAQAFEAAVKE